MKLVVAVMTVAIFAGAAHSLAQSYNPRTGEYEMPGSPISPTSYTECDNLQKQWSQLQQQLDSAHQSCLDTHQNEPQDPRASFVETNPICSHQECQSLHTAKLSVQTKSTGAINSCRTAVAQYQQQQQKKEEAVQRIGQMMSENADALNQNIAQRNAWLNGDSPSTATASEFPAVDSGGSNAGAEIYLNPESTLVFSGNPPDNITNSWVAGTQYQGVADGYYDKQVYVWQFTKTDLDQCPGVSQFNNPIASALFQEIAIAHYQIANGLIVHSNTEKRRQFIKCVKYGDQNYPRYQVTPVHLNSSGSAVIGDSD
jgi:hypothetical protein